MRIGYPCINRTLECRMNSGFRLASYTRERLLFAVENNVSCLGSVLRYNAKNGLLFFRISSDLVPFASHPVMDVLWEDEFAREFGSIGDFVIKKGMGISMHPDQFVVLNSPDPGVVDRSVSELDYHCRLLDLMGLGPDAKVQVHLGGVYGDREAALERFEATYRRLPQSIKTRLVIENDDVSYGFAHCLSVHEHVGVPVLFDAFHDSILPSGSTLKGALKAQRETWGVEDGTPMVDWSTQEISSRKGAHARTIDEEAFRAFLGGSAGYDFDLMLEIKDKERSALKALRIAAGDPRLVMTSDHLFK